MSLLQQYLSNIRTHLYIADFNKVPLHWGNPEFVPDAHKFYFILDGEGWIRINGTDYYPKAGQLFLIPEGVTQSHGTVSDNTLLMYWCHFAASVADMNVLQILEKPDYIAVDEMDRVEKLFKELVFYHKNNGLLDSWKVNSLLLELLFYYFEHSGIQKINMAASSTHRAVETAVKFMEDHLSEPLTVKDLSDQVHMHPNYFSQLFRSMLGLSPILYLNRMRIQRSKTLLASTTLTVAEIASRVGIESHYFSRMFKIQEGYAPSEYRKKTYGQ